MSNGKMGSQDTASLYGAAAVLRLALFTFFPALPDLLTSRVEVSTPVTSFKRCKTALCAPFNAQCALAINVNLACV